MSDTEARVIVSTGATPGQATAYHRDFPEIRAEGESPKAAAEQLVNHLTRALDSALIEWRRESLQNALNDVQEYIKNC